jgi:RNase P/RNase MRP subunit p29
MILPSKREEPPAAVVPPSFPVEIPAGTVLSAEEPKTVADAGTLMAEKAAEPKPAPSDAPIHLEPAPPPSNPVANSAPFPSPEPAVTAPKAEPTKALGTAPAPGEKKEFLLTNGERILGRVISESPDSVYLDHATLGVLTLPRTQIAKRLVELILINGDRIVGDIVAETPECIFVRHASLGMLTVPQAQRSTRVVEAILKDGDRIIGEVLAETDTYTVIRSATLGTVTVQHRQLAMLNRKLEQVALKALPPATPSLDHKPPA